VCLIFAMVGASGLGIWVKGVLLRFWRASLSVHFREVQHDRRSTGSLEAYGRRGSWKGSKYPRKTLDGEMLGSWREGQGPTGNRLGKGTIESGMLSDGIDTIPGHVPVQGIQLKR